MKKKKTSVVKEKEESMTKKVQGQVRADRFERMCFRRSKSEPTLPQQVLEILGKKFKRKWSELWENVFIFRQDISLIP